MFKVGGTIYENRPVLFVYSKRAMANGDFAGGTILGSHLAVATQGFDHWSIPLTKPLSVAVSMSSGISPERAVRDFAAVKRH